MKNFLIFIYHFYIYKKIINKFLIVIYHFLYTYKKYFLYVSKLLKKLLKLF